MRVYCDEMAEARIVRFSLESSKMSYPNFYHGQFDCEIRRDPRLETQNRARWLSTSFGALCLGDGER